MSFKEGQWMYNSSDDGIWGTGEYFDTKEEAIEAGKEYYAADESTYGSFYVGKLTQDNIGTGIIVSRVLEDISENVYDEVGEVAEDYLHDVKREHEDILEKRLNDVLHKWMDEFGYAPHFFKIVNVHRIEGNSFDNEN